ncbi:MAG: peptidoglycan bridge formation glycyltransferase FemA/FemB family protein, partial [Candidatus Aenigmatarchaeota archaeon]
MEEQIPPIDVYYLPEYIKIFENLPPQVKKAFSGETCFAIFGDNENYIIHPFFKREVADLEFLNRSEFANFFDIVSPYGYSGPAERIKNGEIREKLWSAFVSEFQKYCVDIKILTEFARLNPFLRNHEILMKITQGVKQFKDRLVYVDLAGTEDNIRKGMSKSNRRYVRKAREKGVKIRFSRNKEDMEKFF